MEKAFLGFDLETVHALTLKFSLQPMGFDVKAEKKREAGRLRRMLRQHLPGATVRLIFDNDPRDGQNACPTYPDNAVHASLRGVPRPDVPVYLFHAHGFISHPTLSESEIRDVLKEHYPGRNRVSMERPHEEYIDKDGFVRGGIAGYGEYASMEKMVVDFSDGDEECDNYAVVEDMLRINANWPRQSRRFSFGVT